MQRLTVRGGTRIQWQNDRTQTVDDNIGFLMELGDNQKFNQQSKL